MTLLVGGPCGRSRARASAGATPASPRRDAAARLALARVQGAPPPRPPPLLRAVAKLAGPDFGAALAPARSFTPPSTIRFDERTDTEVAEVGRPQRGAQLAAERRRLRRLQRRASACRPELRAGGEQQLARVQLAVRRSASSAARALFATAPPSTSAAGAFSRVADDAADALAEQRVGRRMSSATCRFFTAAASASVCSASFASHAATVAESCSFCSATGRRRRVLRPQLAPLLRDGRERRASRPGRPGSAKTNFPCRMRGGCRRRAILDYEMALVRCVGCRRHALRQFAPPGRSPASPRRAPHGVLGAALRRGDRARGADQGRCAELQSALGRQAVREDRGVHGAADQLPAVARAPPARAEDDGQFGLDFYVQAHVPDGLDLRRRRPRLPRR